jgi:hypothetical protein
MSNGFLFYADGNEYVTQACLSAMSIKTKNDVSISIITKNKILPKYQGLFDNILEPLWLEHDDSRYSILNRWKLYHNTPYDKTIVLDTDTLVLQNLNLWWKFFENYNLFFLNKVFTYRSTIVTDNYYRKLFETNHLPNLYSGMHYFLKSQKSKDFFALVELISKNWEMFYGQFCKEYYPKYPSMDVSFSIASKILDNDVEITNNIVNFVKFVHMKKNIQNWQNVTGEWHDKVRTYLSPNLDFYVGNYLQTGIFHYASKNFLLDNIFKKYEKFLGI